MLCVPGYHVWKFLMPIWPTEEGEELEPVVDVKTSTIKNKTTPTRQREVRNKDRVKNGENYFARSKIHDYSYNFGDIPKRDSIHEADFASKELNTMFKPPLG